jgi:multisubunit Na+/H+ antiporter MnhC subunit
MKFWKEHTALRLTVITVLFAAGIALLIFGWKMTGKLAGLGLMLLGVALLLAALAIYNKPFTER